MVRVLKPRGHLVYKDLVLPGWLAALGRRIAPGHAGYVTPAALERVVETRGLRFIRKWGSGAVYEFVCRRPCPSGRCCLACERALAGKRLHATIGV